ncbi:MAG: DUF6502 family protein [Burkholderiales bacterium]
MEFPSSPAPVASGGGASAAIDALLAVLRPLARLAIDHGVQFNQLEELTKQAMVEAALQAVRDEVGTGAAPISRLSVISGIHRKEVKRLVETPDLSAVRSEQTPASELHTRWATMPEWMDADGSPRALPRRPQDSGIPSFETLARSVTTDVHPRTLLDELLRLGRVEIDASTDMVRLRGDSLVPDGRIEALLAFAGASVGDHLAAVREKLVAGHRIAVGDPDARPPFVEQSVFAGELSAESVELAGTRARVLQRPDLRLRPVIVNGVKFDDSAASVADDLGQARNLSELGLGMFVEIVGTIDEAAGLGKAQSIRIVSQVIGRGDAIDLAAPRGGSPDVEDTVQVTGQITAGAKVAAIKMLDTYGRPFTFDARKARVFNGNKRDLVRGRIIRVEGVRSTVIEASTIRILR